MTTTTVNLENPRIYVGTYKKYNEGSLFGKWIDLTDFSDKDSFMEYCQELHADENDAEFMFQDWENIPDAFIGESHISDNFWEYMEAMEDLSDDEKEAYKEWSDNNGGKNDEIDVQGFRDDYRGNWDSEEKFADNEAEEMGYFKAMENAGLNVFYFDTAAYARDLFIESYWMSETGNVFVRS